MEKSCVDAIANGGDRCGDPLAIHTSGIWEAISHYAGSIVNSWVCRSKHLNLDSHSSGKQTWTRGKKRRAKESKGD
jgi:hypothetical protein